MAIFQGTRLRTVALPARSARQQPPRIVTQAPPRTAPRIRPTGLLMAAILAATMLGLVYLSQTLASNAASLEVTQLAAQSEELGRRLLNQRTLIEQRTDPETVIERARGQGLSLLDEPITLRAP